MLDNLPTRSMQAGKIPPYKYRLKLVNSFINGTNAYSPGIPADQRSLALDLSHYNGIMNLLTAKNAGVKAIWNKATESNYFFDSSYKVNLDKSKDVELPFGGYHFLRPNILGNLQAEYYLRNTNEELYAVLPHVVDVEVAILASVIRSYVERFLSIRNYFPVIYTSNYCWSLVTGYSDKVWLAARCPLFIAHWGATNPLLPPDWTYYQMHQFSANNNNRAIEFGSTGGDPDIDLNWIRNDFLNRYYQPTVEQPSLEILWREAKLHGWNLSQ